MKYGFIGAGNMGGAILKGCLEAGVLKGEDILVFVPHPEKIKELADKYAFGFCGSIETLTRLSDVVLLGVKPGKFDEVLPAAAAGYSKDKIMISMAAGISMKHMEKYFGEDAKLIRIMPNTPSLVGAGMVSVSRNKNVSSADMKSVFDIFESLGKAEEVPEELIHCVIGVSGSSPAYTYMYIDALAEAAVKNGMEKEQALVFAAQAVLGAAKMVLDTGMDPEQLRINVCSPGGTTIEAVNTLMENGFAEKVGEGFQAAVEKSKAMTK